MLKKRTEFARRSLNQSQENWLSNCTCDQATTTWFFEECRLLVCGAVCILWTDVSEERITSIFRVEKSTCKNQCEQVAANWVKSKNENQHEQVAADSVKSRWRRYVPLKRRFTQDRHGTTSQKTAFFIVTAMKTSNLTRDSLFNFWVFVWVSKPDFPQIFCSNFNLFEHQTIRRSRVHCTFIFLGIIEFLFCFVF
jgi:hypothetical protein